MVSSSSGGSRRYRGVRQRQWGSWVSEIRHSISKTRIWLGTFDTAKKAAKAYDEAARVMEGENAKTNFPLPSPSSSSLLSPSVRAKLMHCNCMATLRGPTNNYNVMTNNNHMKYNASSGTSGHITKFKASKVTSYTNNSHKHKDEQYNDGYRSHGGSMTMTNGAHVYTNGQHDPRTLSSDGRYGNGRTLGSKSGAGQYRSQTLVCLRLDDAADRLGVMWQGSADSKPQWVTTIHVPPPPPLPQVHSMTLSSTTISTTNSNIFGSSSSSSSSSSDSVEAPKHDIYPRPKNSSCPADQVSPTISSSSSSTTSMVSTGNLDIFLDATFDFSGHIPTTPRTTLLVPNHSPPTSCYEDEDDSMMMDHIDLIDLIYDSPELGASPNLDILDNHHHHHHHHHGDDDMALMDPLQLGTEASISQALLYLAQAGEEEDHHHHHHHHRHTFHHNQLDDDEDDGEHMYHHHHHHHHHNPFPFLEEYNCHEEENQLWQ